MGAVYRATFDGEAVAVKVLAAHHAAQPAYVRAFQTEIRAMATLHHPHVVEIFDLGRFEEGEHAGCPYAVMGLAEQNLVERCGTTPWEQIDVWLRQVLLGLAHAHARGIIHRDLKPANLLLAEGQVRIADFGLARAFEAVARGEHEQPAGTPGYMPDEQRLGRWRDVGPWTDLYALGKLALDLVGGETPVPIGFDAWVSRLRQPVAKDRYRRAADALLGLERLRSEPLRPLTHFGDLGPAVNTELARTQPYFQDEDFLRPALPPPVPIVLPGTPSAPLPTHRPPRARRLGLALLHRALPAGYEDAAKTLWDEVRRAAAGMPRVVQLHGPDRERMGFWLCHQLHATGVGSVELATHDAHRRPTSGLGGMLARELRCFDLERTEAAERLARSVHADDRAALLTIMAPILGGFGDPLGEEERFQVIDRFFHRDAEGRLPFLWVARGEYADEALAFVRWRRARSRPFLALISASEPVDVPTDRTVVLEPPDRHTQVCRIREALHLPPGIDVDRLAARSGGDPVLASLLIAHPGAATAEDAWADHLAPFLEDDADRLALGCAAVLGEVFREARWRDALRRARIAPTLSLETLFEAGIALPVGLAGHAWCFTSPAVRERIAAVCRDDLPRLHEVAALCYPDEPWTALVRAHHLRAAGEPGRARQVLFAALPWLEGRDPWAYRAIREALG